MQTVIRLLGALAIVPFSVLMANTASAEMALDFDGVDDHTTSTVTLGQDDNFTLEAYAQWRTYDDYYQTLMGFGTAVEIKGVEDEITYISENATTSSAPAKLVDGQWYHFALVRDSGAWKFYLDGVFHDLAQNQAPTPGAADYFRIGGRGANFENWNGTIDEVRVWTVARTQAQIQQYMLSCLSGEESGLYLYYQMEDGKGSSTVSDLTGNGNHSTLNGMDPASDWLNYAGVNCPANESCYTIKPGTGGAVAFCL